MTKEKLNIKSSEINKINWQDIQELIDETIYEKASFFNMSFGIYLEDFILDIAYTFTGDIKKTINDFIYYTIGEVRLNINNLLEYPAYHKIVKSTKDIMFLEDLFALGTAASIDFSIKRQKVDYNVTTLYRQKVIKKDNIKSKNLQILYNEGFLTDEAFLVSHFNTSNLSIDPGYVRKWLIENLKIDFQYLDKLVQEITEDSYQKVLENLDVIYQGKLN